ncbi:MAG TPA: adenylate/guanylate cyclase domain-containing protein [Solirubrobacterales bacterium]|nr:adenylate/guanylate cyclase domain-containing protein [Solirubrobacterales bacterium]
MPTKGPEERLPKRLAASARRLNRNPKLVELARRRRRRAMGEEPAEPPSGLDGHPADHAVHQLALLRGDEHGFLGELGMTALQAWQRLAESQARGRGDVDVVILFTDLVGFSSWALEAGDQAAVRLLGRVTDAIEPPIVERRGEVVKRLGDGLMAAFGSGADAFEAALAFNRGVAEIEVAGHRPRLRTGIHLGRPRKLRGDYFGVDVNIAARLVDAAKPGEILGSRTVVESLPAGAVEAKRRRFSAKGAPKGLEVYSLRENATD